MEFALIKCVECGQSFEVEFAPDGEVYCPHCGEELYYTFKEREGKWFYHVCRMSEVGIE